jgi:hypothetical protein
MGEDCFCQQCSPSRRLPLSPFSVKIPNQYLVSATIAARHVQEVLAARTARPRATERGTPSR